MAEYELQQSPKQFSRVSDSFITRGLWTPEITCNTPGDLSITYGVQRGKYVRTHDVVDVWFYVSTSVFSHSTASGFWIMTGLPYPAASWDTTFTAVGTGMIGNTTVAGYTYLTPVVFAGAQIVSFAIGSLADDAIDTLAVAHIPTGELPIFQGYVKYFTSTD